MSSSGMSRDRQTAFRAGPNTNERAVSPQYEDQLSEESLGDLFGRFNVWAGNIGAGGQGQASLDYRLRDASEIKEHIISTLRYIHEALHEESSASSSSNASTTDTSSSFGAGAGESPASPGTELQQLQHAIATFVSNLYKISTVIRKHTAPRDMLVKSAKIDTSFYEYFDEMHVREKYPLADEALVKRLGNAISRRRKYLKYREQHRQKLSLRRDAQSVGQTAVDESTASPVFERSPTLRATPEATEAISHDHQASSLMEPSTMKASTTASTFLPPDISVLQSENIDRISDAGTQTSYGSISTSQHDTLAIPQPPKSSSDGRDFECPYCFSIRRMRSTDPWQQRKEWKRHVLRDIQPYMCTFGGCNQTNTLFERRRDWIAHELQLHRTEWCCNTQGHQVYGSRKEFHDHMQNQHSGSFDDLQLDSLARMSGRPAVNLKFACPLCCSERFNDLSIDRLEQHLGRHLEVIATFALPSGPPESQASQDSIVTQDANPNDRSSSMARDVASEGDSLSDSLWNDYLRSPNETLERQPIDPSGQMDEDWGFMRKPDAFSGASSPLLTGMSATPEAVVLGEICDWLASNDQSRKLAAVEASRDEVVGTGTWFFRLEEYQRLREGLITGCGKTVLISTIIQQLLRDSTIPAFYFFDRDSAAQLSPSAVIRALIAQLVRRADEVPASLLTLYQAGQQNKMSPTLDQLRDVLYTLFDLFNETYLIFDGLNLIPSEITKMLAQIVESAIVRRQKVRLLATSRISLVVEDAIRFGPRNLHQDGLQWHTRFNTIMIPRSVLDGDIYAFLVSKTVHSNESQSYDADARLIAREAKGMFIWASVRFESLKETRYTDPFELSVPRSAIEMLWTGFLARILAQAGPKDVEAAVRVLHTLSVTERRLNADEIHDNLSYDLNTLTWGNWTYSDQHQMWRTLPALLELIGQPKDDEGFRDGWREHLGLIHPSLRQFLLSESIRKSVVADFAVNESKAQRIIARQCVAYLTQWDRSDSYRSKRGWTAYAGRYWHTHIKKVDSDTYLVSECIGLLHHQSPAFSHWTYLNRRVDNNHKVVDDDFAQSDAYPSQLYYAALLGLRGAAKSLLEDDADVNVTGGRYQLPILAAIVSGEDGLVDLLLQHGADPDFQYWEPNEVFVEATKKDHDRATSPKLNSSDGTQNRWKQSGTAVHLAVRKRQPKCLSSLLKAGPDLEARNDHGETPLHLAAKQNDVTLMRHLINHGARTQSVDAQSFTPFLTAVSNGSNEAVGFLVENGAEPERSTALCMAARGLKLDIVRLLVDCGADVNHITSYRCTPLHLAAGAVNYMEPSLRIIERQKDVLLYLLEHGADPSITDENGRYPEDLIDNPVLKNRIQEMINLVGAQFDQIDQGERSAISRSYESHDMEPPSKGIQPLEHPTLANLWLQRTNADLTNVQIGQFASISSPPHVTAILGQLYKEDHDVDQENDLYAMVPEIDFEKEFPQDMIIDHFGRLIIWAGHLNAAGHGPGSLDHRLSDDKDVKGTVVNHLQHLLEALQDASVIVSGSRLPHDHMSPDPESSFSDEGEDEDGKTADPPFEDPPWTELSQLAHSMDTLISNLYKIAVTVRERRPENDRIRAAANIDMSPYEVSDVQHVKEAFPNADPVLITRLGNAITMRRKYPKYREQQYHKALASEQTSSASNSTVATPLVRDISVLNLDSEDNLQSESTSPTDHEPPPSGTAADSLDIPLPPSVSTNSQPFTCPYCFDHFRLPSDVIKQHKTWQTHVLQDLEPYNCTFTPCFRQYTLFETRDEWMRHELNTHRVQWCCNAPGHKLYNNREDFQEHFRSPHSEVTTLQSDDLDTCFMRPGYDLKYECPLRCDERFEDLGIDELEPHLGRHLESLATFAFVAREQWV
ncbi:MAG: hypothetical protein Q9218_004619 [Villophora microphyllina]